MYPVQCKDAHGPQATGAPRQSNQHSNKRLCVLINRRCSGNRQEKHKHKRVGRLRCLVSLTANVGRHKKKVRKEIKHGSLRLRAPTLAGAHFGTQNRPKCASNRSASIPCGCRESRPAACASLRHSLILAITHQLVEALCIRISPVLCFRTCARSFLKPSLTQPSRTDQSFKTSRGEDEQVSPAPIPYC